MVITTTKLLTFLFLAVLISCNSRNENTSLNKSEQMLNNIYQKLEFIQKSFLQNRSSQSTEPVDKQENKTSVNQSPTETTTTKTNSNTTSQSPSISTAKDTSNTTTASTITEIKPDVTETPKKETANTAEIKQNITTTAENKIGIEETNIEKKNTEVKQSTTETSNSNVASTNINKVQSLQTSNQSNTVNPKVDNKEICHKDLHMPFGEQTRDMQYTSVLSYIIISFIALLVRIMFQYFGNTLNNFSELSFNSILKVNYFFFFVIGLFFTIFSMGGFSTFVFNMENFFLGSILFYITWIIFTTCLIMSLNPYIHFLKKFNSNNINFKFLKLQYEKITNAKYGFVAKATNKNKNEEFEPINLKEVQVDLDFIFEQFEYLALKESFISPVTPQFKSFQLKSDFDFGNYLTKALAEECQNFFAFSWTSSLGLIFFLLFWTVVIEPTKASLMITIFSPFLLLFFQFMLYLYLKVVYRRFVPVINESNYLEYQKFDNHFNTNIPPYLEKIVESKITKNGLNTIIQNNNTDQDILITVQNEKSNYNQLNQNGYSMTKHFNIRASNYFEDNILWGKTGMRFFTNLNQFLSILFALILVEIYTRSVFLLANKELWLVLVVILTIIYFCLSIVVTNKNLKYLNMINSTESNKKEHLVDEIIYAQTINSAKMCHQIIQVFKKIYFDILINYFKKRQIKKNEHGYSGMETNKMFEFGTKQPSSVLDKYEKFNSLTKHALRHMIDLNIIRFKFLDFESADTSLKVLSSQDNIYLGDELRYFIKSCGGGNMSDKDVENMLHLIEDFDSIVEKRYLTNENLYNIWAANIHFSKVENEHVVRTVIDSFTEEMTQDKDALSEGSKISNSDKLDIEKLKKMLDIYSEYFSKEEKTFLLNELSNHKPNFSKDTMISFLVTTSYPFPN